MLSALKRLITPAPEKTQAHTLYAALVAQARSPYFYRECRVPDSLDGRFEMVLLHLFLTLRRLKAEGGEEGLFQRALVEAFFDDMDRSLREMGVSDTGVGKRIKRMAAAFYGRMQAYEQSFQAGDAEFAEALSRNVYGTVEAGEEGAHGAARLAAYAKASAARLESEPTAGFYEGIIAFAPLEAVM